jgi:AmmeMemoRadiSam system protein A
MTVKIACLVPHPPILIPEVGGKEINRIQATVKAMKDLYEEVAKVLPQTLVFISPHSPAFADAFTIKTRPCLSGSLSRFRARKVSFTLENDIELAGKILDEATKLGVPVCKFDEKLIDMGYSDELDHGILVPLYYLKGDRHASMISVSISDLSYFKHYLFGLALQKAADLLDRDIAFVASGDLSHRLTTGAPGGYNAKGKDFDNAIKNIFQKGSLEDFFGIEKSLIKDAGECGFRSILVLAGVLNGYSISSKVLSYEGPFGVGYLVAVAKPIKREEERDMVDKIASFLAAYKEKSIQEESAPVKLARKAVETYIKHSRLISPPSDLPNFLLEKQGAVFVSLKKDSALRGCIGTTAPTQPNLAEEIIKNAVHAATRDPRFSPVRSEELADLVYSVDILEEPKKIPDESFLNPKEYGVIVESGFRKGLLLPDIEGVDTVEEQIAIAKRKAGISLTEPVVLYRFKVIRYR